PSPHGTARRTRPSRPSRPPARSPPAAGPWPGGPPHDRTAGHGPARRALAPRPGRRPRPTSLWLTLVTPGAARPDVRGRVWAWFLVTGPAGFLLTVVLTAASGQTWSWPWVLAGGPRRPGLGRVPVLAFGPGGAAAAGAPGPGDLRPGPRLGELRAWPVLRIRGQDPAGVPTVDVPHERRVDVVAEQFLQAFRQVADDVAGHGQAVVLLGPQPAGRVLQDDPEPRPRGGVRAATVPQAAQVEQRRTW